MNEPLTTADLAELERMLAESGIGTAEDLEKEKAKLGCDGWISSSARWLKRAILGPELTTAELVSMLNRKMKMVYVFIAAACVLSGCAQIKETFRTIGHTTRDVTTEIGHGARDVTREIGHGTRDVVRNVGEGTRDTTKTAAEEVKKAVKPTPAASEY
jgi:hypothetical protein